MPLRTIETVESWAKGDGATLEDVRKAADAAYAAGYAAYAAADAARSKTLTQCADIVRKHYPQCPLTKKGKKNGINIPVLSEIALHPASSNP